MKPSRVLAIVIGAIVLTAAGIAIASTPPGQVLFGPGQPVSVYGATPAAPGATAVGGFKIDTVNTLTNGYLFQINNNGSDVYHIDFAGVVTRSTTGDAKTCSATSGVCETITANALTTGQAISIPHTTSVIASGGALIQATSTSVDTGTTTGNLLDLSSSGSLAGVLTRISGAGLTTGTAMLIKGGSEANVTTAGRYFSVQDSAGAELFGISADGHQVFAQTTVPVVTNTGGSGASCTACTDTNGKIVVTTAANTNVITLTFNKSATARGCVITPADANTAVDLKAAGGGVVTMAAGTFTISSPSANWAANQKNIYYSCFF